MPAASPSELRTVVARLPSGPGVYRFRDVANHVLYIGRAVNLRRRVASYFNPPISRMAVRIQHIEAVSCRSEHEAAWLERNLLERALPPWNRTAGGQESEVFIRVDWRSSRPGIRVVHALEPSDKTYHFGPYLGGLKVRMAVAALHRVMPLEYSGQSLSGFGNDMARVLGIESSNRLDLADDVISALERKPGAVDLVRVALARRRDALAELLDFEQAAKLQAEIDGFEWVVSEQRVTSVDSAEFEVCGWQNGILVQFGVRRGRLCTWRQRRCAEGESNAYTARTPADWVEFGALNASLAGSLMRS